MIIVMAPGSTEEELQAVVDRIQILGYKAHLIRGVERTVIGAVGHEDKTPLQVVEQMPGVEAAIPILKPFKLASAEWKREPTLVRVDEDVVVGGEEIVLIGGPGVVESEEQLMEAAQGVKAAGGKMLRACVFSHYMSPYATAGSLEDSFRILKTVREETGLKIVTEMFSTNDLDPLMEVADMIQIGARNCQNYALLRCVGRTRKPVLLKRGMSTTIKEFMMAAEYVLSEGNSNLILCERGIRAVEGEVRFTLDLNAVPVIKRQSHLPVFVDPSHGAGKHDMVPALARSAIAAGADGLMIEVHPHPERAHLDGQQSLRPAQFAELVGQLRRVAAAVGRKL